ncbi:MAG TPA: hypothetical protein VFG47_13080, partial [Geminicoccaceae bacterium]|nr:hypothetical protein [Geminicoccaceae bacterium]
MSPTALVRKLALRAPDRAAVAEGARTLETALALAPLPPVAPGELVLVRRLELGRLPRGIGAQALSLRLARALAEIRPLRLRSGDAEHPDAAAVAFAGEIEALAGHAPTAELVRGRLGQSFTGR